MAATEHDQEAQDNQANETAQGNGQASAQGDGAQAQAAAPAEQIAQLKSEKQELHDRMLRVAADFENYRRRTRKEMEEAGLRGMESLLKEILPVMDNLDRAVDAAAAAAQKGERVDPSAAALLEGVKMVQRQFFTALEKFGIKPFEAKGQPFDPALHEAVQQIDSDTLPAGSVAAVYQRGYMAGQRLLRPALVSVVRGRPAAPGNGGPSQSSDLRIDDADPFGEGDDARSGEIPLEPAGS